MKIDWDTKQDNEEEENLEWEEDWEDEEVGDDEFSKKIRQELQKHKMLD